MEEQGEVVISYGNEGLSMSVEFLNASEHGLVEAQDPKITLAGLEVQV